MKNTLQAFISRIETLKTFSPPIGLKSRQFDAVDGDTLLHIAVTWRDEQAVQELLDAGLDPNIRGDLSYTPLHYAARSGCHEIAKILLKAGAETDVINELDLTPFDICSDETMRGILSGD